jgi:zinc transport system substrate-binding protein
MKKFSFLSIIIPWFLVTQFSYVQADRLTVVASVFPLFDFAREVAGPAADVRLLLPPGVDPHSWEPKPSDILEFSRADIILYTSDRMEPWAGTFVKSVRKRDTISVEIMDRLELMEHHEAGGPEEDHHDEHLEDEVHEGEHHHGEDPHFWMNLFHSARAVQVIGQVLANSDPKNAELYRSNASSSAARLKKLDERFMTGLKDCASRQIVTGGHAAFGHLARRYGLEQISVYGLSPDAEPSPRHLAEIVQLVKENNIQTIFSEELMNPRMAEVLSRETGTKVLVLNPAGNLSPDQWARGTTFLHIMESNLATLREGLYCD